MTGCSVSPEDLAEYKQVSKELGDEIQRAEARVVAEDLEPEARDKALDRIARLKVAKQQVDAIIDRLGSMPTSTDPIVNTGETVKAVGDSLPAPVGVWVSLAGALIASIGRNVVQQRSIKNARGALAAVHANRQANGDTNADFSAATSAILRAHMTDGQRKEVRKSLDMVDKDLVEAINVVAASKPKRRTR